MRYYDEIRLNLTKIINRGFFFIFGTNILSKFIPFILSIFIIRILTKVEYGAYSYANNIVSMVMLVSTMGLSSGILQFVSSNHSQPIKKAYLALSLKLGVVINLIVSILLLILLNYIKLPIPESKKYIVMLSLFFPFALISDLLSNYLRATFQNKGYGILKISAILSYFCFGLLGLILFKVPGLISARYISKIISIFAGIYIIRNLYKNIDPIKLKFRQVIEFIKFSITAMLTNTLSSILYMIDIFLIALIIKNTVILSEYKVATLIPFAMNLIPTAIVMFVYPYFARNKNNINYIKINYKKLISLSAIVNGSIALLLILFSSLIIKLFFGESYLNSVLPFRILSIGYFVASTFRIPAGNIIASLGKMKVNLYNAIISGFTNIVLDIYLITKLGSIGAAISTVSIIILSSIIGNFYLFYLFSKGEYYD